jgi:acyl-coenzyme A synthetase/AMP-(fatty) acid ligase
MVNWIDMLDRHGDNHCLVLCPKDRKITFRELAGRVAQKLEAMKSIGLDSRSVVAFPARYTIESVCTLLSVAQLGAIAVPLPEASQQRIDKLLTIAMACGRLEDRPDGGIHFHPLIRNPDPIAPWCYQQLRDRKHAGLVLFTSGSSGTPKAAVQDLHQLQQRHHQPRSPCNMLAFMQLDHIGGINTMLYAVCHGGALVVPASRSPHDVANAIERHRVDVLPVSPSFLNLLLISGALDQYDFSSLKRVTYGSEAMPQSVLRQIAARLTHVQLLQTYGTTELGILRSRSQDNQSLWIQVGGSGFETKVLDGRLWVKAPTAMVGYLNAPFSLDEDGFIDTGDEVEVRGSWMRILGRKGELINVGGTKISPTEVESVLLEMPEVVEASVVGVSHPLVGQVVQATVRLQREMPLVEFKNRMRSHCQLHLPAEAIPAKLLLADQPLVTERFKRDRDPNRREDKPPTDNEPSF